MLKGPANGMRHFSISHQKTDQSMAIIEHTTQTIDSAFGQLELLAGGAGPTLVFIHGEEGQRGWLPHHAALADAFTLRAPTLPGLGGSALPEWVQRVPDMAKVLLAGLDAARISHCILGGSSMGGWIAAEMASMEPARFAGLVLVGSQGTATGDLDTPDLFLMHYRRYISFGYADTGTAAFKQMWEGELDDAAVTDELAVMELAALLGFKPYMHDRSLLPALARYSNPAQLVWGDQDVITPAVVAERFLTSLPDSELATISAAGHYVHLEQPEKFAHAVIKFGKRLAVD